MGLQFGEHTASNRDPTASKRGESHYMRLRRAYDTRPEGFVSCKTPTSHTSTLRPGPATGRSSYELHHSRSWATRRDNSS